MAIDKAAVLAMIDSLKASVEALPDVGGDQGELVAQLQAQVASLQSELAAKQVELDEKSALLAQADQAAKALDALIPDA